MPLVLLWTLWNQVQMKDYLMLGMYYPTFGTMSLADVRR